MKQDSQGTQFSVQSGALTNQTAISAINTGTPAILTLAAVPPGPVVAGAIVMPTGVGWPSLDNLPFAVKEVGTPTANDVKLEDSDTRSEAQPIGINAKLGVVPFTEACMATLTFASPAGTVIDVTTLCDTARSTLSGMPGIATWQATGFWDSQDEAQARLHQLKRTREYVAFKCIFNDGSGLLFTGNVNMSDVRAGVDQAVAITVGGAVTGTFQLINFVDSTAVAA